MSPRLATRAIWLAIVLATVCAVPGRTEVANGAPTAPGGRARPAVARIVTPQRDGMAFGSGTLVAVNDTQGLVLTNWHVVEEATAPVTVMFPDGFSSTASVLKADRDWDLAALVIRRPNAEPVALAIQPPRRGETLTIAGYGPGPYREVAGPCTQYVAPGPRHAFEMVELAATARQGDSGGPIFNSRGELAGVLFGTGGGSTTGSYCGRVRWFLASILGDTQRAPPEVARVAQQPRQQEPGLVTLPPPSAPPPAPAPQPAAQAAPLVAVSAPQAVAPPTPPASTSAADPGQAAAPLSSPVERPATQQPPGTELVSFDALIGTNRFEQIKTALAAVGLLTIFFSTLRLLSPTRKRKARGRKK